MSKKKSRTTRALDHFSAMRRDARRRRALRQNRLRQNRSGRLQMENLEERQLLTINPSLLGSTVAFAGDAADDELYLRLNTANQELEYSLDGTSFTNDLDTSPGIQALAINTGSVHIDVGLAGGQDDLFLSVDLSNQLVSTGATMKFDGGSNVDRLHAPSTIDNHWLVDGTDFGILNAQAKFESVEELEGGVLNDTFDFDNGIVYTGKILGSDGQLLIQGNTDITFGTNAIVSSRQVTAGSSHLTSPSVGDSGNIRIEAEAITLQNNASVVADADSGFAPGNVEFNAKSSSSSILANKTASISVTDSLVRGQDVSLVSETTLAATAEGLPASLGSDLAVIVNSATATTTVDGTSSVIGTGDVLITSETSVTDKAVAYASASGVFTADAALASTTVSTDSRASVTGNATIDTPGTLTVWAKNATDIKAESDGDENGTNAKGGTVAVNFVDVNTRAFIDQSASVTNALTIDVIAESVDLVDSNANSTPLGATGNSPDTETLLDNFNATTTDGDVDVAAAVAITDFHRDVQAFIASDATIDSVQSIKTLGIATGSITTDADASLTSNDAAEAVGVGINRINSSVESFVAGPATVTTTDATIQSETHNSDYDENTYKVSAKSGIGEAGEFAGAFAANFVVNSSQATVAANADLDLLGGDLSVTSENNSVIGADATPHEPMTSVDAGTGASFAIQVVENQSAAELAAGSDIGGAHNIDVSTTANHNVTTNAEAGVKAGVAKSPVLAATYHQNETSAHIRDGLPLSATGDITVQAQNAGATESIALGSLHASDKATNAAFGFTISSDTVEASTQRDLDAGGDITIKAHQSAISDADATANVTGTRVEEDPTADDESETIEEQGENTKDLLDQLATDQGTAPTGADVPKPESPEKKTVQFAGAFAVNLPASIADAAIGPNLNIVAGGDINVTSCNNTDAAANADASIIPEEVPAPIEEAEGTDTLVAEGSPWGYLDIAQGTEWIRPEYDASNWPKGPAPLGYAQRGVATTIDSRNPQGTPSPTVYFRTDFVVDDQTEYTAVQLRVRYDDAAAVYINGVEVARTEGLKPNAPFDQLSSVTIDGEEEGRFVDIDLSPEVATQILRPGRNVIAVEVHQDSLSNSDLAFDMELKGTKSKGDVKSDPIKTGVAVAVALNVPLEMRTTASIGENTAASGENILVETSMKPLNDGDDTAHSFSATAKSGVGSEDEASKAVAGALAVNVVSNTSNASIEPNASLTLTGGSLTVSATDNADNSASALPQKDGTTAGTKALGASFAIDVAQNKTIAEIDTDATVDGAVDVTVEADSTNNMTTKAEAGVKAGKARAPVVGVSLHNNETTAIIRSGDEIVASGDLSINATHAGKTETDAIGSADATERAVNASLALTLSDDTTHATTERDLDVGGSVTISAHSSAFSDADATASVTGTHVVEESTDDDDESEEAKEQSDNIIDHVNELANDKGMKESDAETPETKTAEDKKVQFAAAVAVNLPTSVAQAWIPDDLVVTAGDDLTVTACNNTDAHANADASAVQKSVTDNDDTDDGHTDDGDTDVDGDGTKPVPDGTGDEKEKDDSEKVLPTKTTKDTKDDESSKDEDEDEEGTKVTGVAIAIAVNVPLEASTTAYVGERADVEATNITVGTQMKPVPVDEGDDDVQHSFGAKAISGVGAEAEGSKSYAGALAINVVSESSEATIRPNASATLTGGDLTVSAVDTSESTADATPKESKVTGDAVGLGASFAINVVQNKTTAEIQKDVDVTTSNDITISATSDHTVTTNAEAGVTAGKSFAPVIGITYHNSDTSAALRPGPAVSQSGDLTIHARQGGKTTTNAEGSAEAKETAVSAALALNIADHDTNGLLERDVDAAGDISITAHATSMTQADAKATASGTEVVEDDSTKKQSEKVDEQADKVTDFVNGLAADNDMESTDADAAEPKTQDGSVTFAAAVGLNIVQSNVTASIADGLTVAAGGDLEVLACNNTDAAAKADGQAVNQGQVNVGIAVAVGINWIDANTTATVGTGAKISATDITVHALMTEIPGKEENDTENSFHADAISGAGANNVGVAGSFALNRLKNQSLANLQSDVVVTMSGDLSVKAENHSESGAKALSKEEGSAEAKAGVGVSVALDLLQHTTEASIGSNVAVNGANNILVSANANHNVETKATAGSKGGVSVTPAFALSSIKNNTSAFIDAGPTIVVGGGIDVKAKQLTSTLTTADANAAGDKAVVGVAVSLGLVRDSTTAFVDRSLDAAGDLNITAFTHSDSDSIAIASAAGGKEEDEDTEEDAVDKDIDEKLDFADLLSAIADVDAPSEDAPAVKTREGAVTVAAAVALELARITTHAYVGQDHSVTADGLLVSAASDADSTADADGKAVDVGNQTTVGVGVAVAINRPINETLAFIDQSTDVTANGVSVEAIMAIMEMDQQQVGGTHTFVADATAGAGSSKISFAGSLALNVPESTHRAWVGSNASVTNATLILDADNVTDNRANAVAHAPVTGGKLGIGPSVALNLVDTTTETLIDNGVTILNGGDVLLEPSSDTTSTTSASGGAEGGVAIDATVAITTLNETTAGKIAAGTDLIANGDVTIDATHIGADNTTADGAFSGSDVGIGASFALVVSNGQTTAELDRSVQAGGSISLDASSDRTYDTIAKSSASGANHPDDLTGSTDDVESFSALDDYGVSTSSGSLNVAAALAITDMNNDVQAIVTPGHTLNAGDSILIGADRISGFHSQGDASAVSPLSKVGVGVGVALSLAKGDAVAYLDDNTTANAGNNIQVTASTEQNSSDLKHQAPYQSKLGAHAISGAGAKKVGVAGAFAFTDSDVTTSAFIDADSALDAGRDILIDAAAHSKLSAAASSVAFGGKVGIGASVALVDSDNVVEGFLGDRVDAEARHVEIRARNERVGTGGFSFNDFTSFDKLNALRENNYYAEALGGSAGESTAIQGSVAITTLDDSVQAFIGDDAAVDAAGNVEVDADNMTTSRAITGSIAGSLGVSVGLSNADTVNRTVTRGYLGSNSNTTAGADVSISARTEQEFAQLGVSAALASTTSVNGVVTVLVSDNVDEAYVGSQALVSAGGDMNVEAENRLITKAIAGQLSGGGSTGIGASNVTNVIENSTRAYLAPSTVVDVNGLLSLDADAVQDMFAIAAGGAGAGSVGIAGSATVNKLETTTESFIDRSAKVNTNTLGRSVILDANDETYLYSIAGSAAVGGSVGIGAGADVGVLDKNTQAYIAPLAEVNASNIVGVEASSSEDISSLAASLGIGGSVGIAGAAGVYTLDITTQAHIDNNATVFSQGNVRVHADDDNEIDVIDGNLSAAGSVSVGAAAAVVTVNKTVEAFIGNGANVTALATGNASNVSTGDFIIGHIANGLQDGEVFVPTVDTTLSDDLSITKQRIASPKTKSFRGLSVTAINRDDIETITLSGGAAGAVAVNAGGSVNLIHAHTRAFIDDDASINSDNTSASTMQSILVAAGSDTYHTGVTGVASLAGTVSVAPGADITVVNNETLAYIGKNADVEANDRITVNAEASEDILSVSAGVAVAGAVGVAGAVSPIKIDNTTHAFVDSGATVFTDGNLIVSANDDTDADIVAGAIGAGGVVGVGGSVGVITIDKDTQAYLAGGAVVDALGNSSDEIIVITDQAPDIFQPRADNLPVPEAAILSISPSKGISIQATSTEDLTNIVVAGAGGYFAGVAGAVAVDLIDSNTFAFIGQSAQVNQSGGGTPGVDQAVNVTAANDLKMLAIGGSVAIGIAGVAGGVDVGVIENDTSAYIDDSAKVSARQDVGVRALSDKTIDSWAASAGLGFVGVAGSVSVYGISGNLDADSIASLNTTAGGGATPEHPNAQSYVDAQLSKSGLPASLLGYNANPSDPSMNSMLIDAATSASSVSVASVLGSANLTGTLSTPVSAGTTAFIDRSATVESGREIIVDASSEIDFDATVGGLAVGVVGAGGSVSAANINENVESYIAGNVSSIDDTHIRASFNESTDGSAYAGQGGIVGLGAQVVAHKDHTDVDASLKNTARVSNAEDLHITADTNQVMSADAIGGQLAGVALGASIATTVADGSTQAYVDHGTVLAPSLNSRGSIGDLDIAATSDISASTKTIAVSVGVVSGPGSVAISRIDPDIDAFVGNNTTVVLTGDMDIVSDSQADADAEALGVAVALGVAIGVSSAEATVLPDVSAFIGTNASIDVRDDINVISRHNVTAAGTDIVGGAEAEARTPSVGLLAAGAGAIADATTSPVLDASIRRGAQIRAGNNINVRAHSHDSADAESKGLGVGIVGVGLTDGDALANGQTVAQITGDIHTGRNVVIEAVDRHVADAKTRAVSGGIVSGAGSWADATVTPTVRANTGDSVIDVRGDVSIVARSETDADADSRGVNALSGVGIGFSRADARIAPNVDSYIDQGAHVNAAGDVELLASHNYRPNGNVIINSASTTANASGVGVLSGAGAITSSVADSDVTGQVRANAIVNAGEDFSLVARNHDVANADADGDAYGIVGIGRIESSANVTGTSDAQLLGFADVSAGRDARIASTYTNDATAVLTTASGGLVVVGDNESNADINTRSTATTGASSQLDAGRNIVIDAGGLATAEANTSGVQVGLVTVGNSNATADETMTVRAALGTGSTTHAENDLTIRARHNFSSGGSAITGNSIDAVAKATAGGLVGSVSNTTVAANSRLTVDALIGNQATVTVGRDVQMEALGGGRADSNADGRSLGLIAAFGRNTANSKVTNRTTAFVQSDANINADHDFNMLSRSRNLSESHAIGGAGSLIFTSASTDANAAIDNRTVSRIGSDARVHAENQILVEAVTRNDTHSESEIETAGLITKNRTESDTDIVSETNVVVDSDAYLTADYARFHAVVERTVASGDAFSKTIAAGSTTDAASFVDVTSTANVIVHSDAIIEACKLIELLSCHLFVDTDSDALARIAAGITGTVTAQGHNDLDIHSNVDVQVNATLRTDNLVVNAKAPTDTDMYGRTAEADADTVIQYVKEIVEEVKKFSEILPWPFGVILKWVTCFVEKLIEVVLHSDETALLTGSLNSHSSVNIDGNIEQCPPKRPSLEIHPDGTMTADGVFAELVDGEILISDIVNDRLQSILISAPNGNVSGNGRIEFAKTYEAVEIINRSDKDIRIRDVRVRAENPQRPDLEVVTGHDESQFELGSAVEATTVRIENLGTGDVILEGEITNPFGSVSITNRNGDIGAASGNLIHAHDLMLSAPNGTVGDVQQSLHIDVVKGMNAGRGSVVSEAGDGTNLSVRSTEYKIDVPQDYEILPVDLTNLKGGGETNVNTETPVVFVPSLEPGEPASAIEVSGKYDFGVAPETFGGLVEDFNASWNALADPFAEIRFDGLSGAVSANAYVDQHGVRFETTPAGIAAQEESDLVGSIDGYDNVTYESDQDTVLATQDNVRILFDPPVSSIGSFLALPTTDGSPVVELFGEDGQTLGEAAIETKPYEGQERVEGLWMASVESPVIGAVEIRVPAGGSPDLFIDNLRFARPDVVVSGDFDGDGRLGCSDLRSLNNAVTANSQEPQFDLNGDGRIDFGDQGAWVSLVDPVSGDANLDRVVDSRDLNLIGLNWQSKSDALTWCDGDFTGNQVVDARDLNELALNWQSGKARAPQAAIPSKAANIDAVVRDAWRRDQTPTRWKGTWEVSDSRVFNGQASGNQIPDNEVAEPRDSRRAQDASRRRSRTVSNEEVAIDDLFADYTADEFTGW